MTYIITDPWTRVNENWADNSVSWQTVTHAYKDPLISGGPNDTRFQAKFYKHIALDIVTESVYNYPYPQITEKTLRPISCKRMFVVVAAPGTLELLHRKGFMTFADVIDERYDTETDPVHRWHMVCQAIKQFVSKPLSEIQNIVSQHQDALEHNFRILLDLEAKECEILNDTNT